MNNYSGKLLFPMTYQRIYLIFETLLLSNILNHLSNYFEIFELVLSLILNLMVLFYF
jgi:hypothetical protein